MAYSYDRRTVTASAEREFWERADSTVSGGDADHNLSNVDALLKKYGKACVVAYGIFEKLGPALESPEIAEMAKALKERADDVEKLLKAHRRIGNKLSKLEDEVEALCEKIGKAAKPDDSIDGEEVLKAVKKLKVYNDLKEIADEVVEIDAKIEQQEGDTTIDWTLDDYLGGSARVYDKLQNNVPDENPFEDEANSIPLNIYGALQYYDAQYLEERVVEHMPEAEEESE